VASQNEDTMGEADYNRLLDAVGSAMKLAPAQDFLSEDDDFMVVPVPANDNHGRWPHLPFPDGWTASC
jgi:hypothetical protein